mmetsp:Transcript_7755/g.13011  ORF Transcript_7755/g.13011 Transcript_7755/m.13011 type:complete len:176 (-) Transcript_7755:777-1304(-)
MNVGNTQNRFLSTQKEAMEAINNHPHQSYQPLFIPKQIGGDKEAFDIKKDTRKTHFQLGNSQPNYLSHAGNTLVEHLITKESVMQTELNRNNQINKMRQANFKLPYQKNMNIEQSTYKQNISDIAASDHFLLGKPHILTDLKNSSITIGGKEKLKCITETADSYTQPLVREDMQL